MEFIVDSYGSIVCISTEGRFAIGPKLDLFRELIEEQVAEGNLRVIFNMAGVKYADSAGLGEMIASRRALNDVGGRLVIAGATGKVKDLLELTRIGDLIDVYEDVEGAMGSFEG